MQSVRAASPELPPSCRGGFRLGLRLSPARGGPHRPRLLLGPARPGAGPAGPSAARPRLPSSFSASCVPPTWRSWRWGSTVGCPTAASWVRDSAAGPGGDGGGGLGTVGWERCGVVRRVPPIGESSVLLQPCTVQCLSPRLSHRVVNSLLAPSSHLLLSVISESVTGNEISQKEAANRPYRKLSEGPLRDEEIEMIVT